MFIVLHRFWSCAPHPYFKKKSVKRKKSWAGFRHVHDNSTLIWYLGHSPDIVVSTLSVLCTIVTGIKDSQSWWIVSSQFWFQANLTCQDAATTIAYTAGQILIASTELTQCRYSKWRDRSNCGPAAHNSALLYTTFLCDACYSKYPRNSFLLKHAAFPTHTTEYFIFGKDEHGWTHCLLRLLYLEPWHTNDTCSTVTRILYLTLYSRGIIIASAHITTTDASYVQSLRSIHVT